MKLGDIEDRGAIVSLVRHAIVFPAYSEVQSQGGIDFPFVLEIGHVECAPQLMATPGRSVGNSVKVPALKTRIKRAGAVGKAKRITRCQTLIQSNSANFHSRLERVAPVHKCEVVDDAVSGAHLVIRLIVVNPYTIFGLHRIGQGWDLGVDKWGAVYINLPLIHQPR